MNNLELAIAGVKIVAEILNFPAPELYIMEQDNLSNKEILDIWGYETNNYIMPSGKNNEVDDLTYLNQKNEIDAISFAHKMMLEHLELKTIMPQTNTCKNRKKSH